MSFQLSPLQPLDDPDRQEREKRCQEARREFGRAEYVAFVTTGTLVGCALLALLRALLGW